MTWLYLSAIAGSLGAAAWGWVRSFLQERRFRDERQKRIAAETATKTALEQAETYRRGMEVADERRKRTEEVISVYRAEAEKWRRATLQRIEDEGREALGAVQGGDPSAAGRFLRDVMRAHEDDDGDSADPGGGAAADGRAPAAGRVPAAGRPADRGRK